MSDKSILDALDPEQREAALALNGPVAIIAGPGSGKTRTISHRIAHGVQSGSYNPSRVLALSYTNRAASEIRSRLRQLGAGGVQVRTFHSAALAQLQYFWPQLTGYASPKLLTNKRPLIAEAAGKLRLKLSDSEIGEIASELEYLRYSLSDFEDYQVTSRLPTFLTQDQFAQLADGYLTLKQERRLIDWEDAILLCTGMLRNEPKAMSHFESQYRHFTVDEYQDISPLQQALLETWLGEREEVCVVGDPRQTIYSFAGANSSFLGGFKDRFPSAKIIELNRNYRSADEIVQLANATLPDTSLVAVRKSPGEISVQLEPDAKVVTLVAEEIEATKQLDEVAILARTNAQLEPFERALKAKGISCQVRGQGRFFSRPEVMQANSALRALSVSESSEPLFAQVSKIVTELGWNSKPSKDEKWLALQWFIDVLDELGNPSLDEYLRELAERERSGHEPSREAVTLATVHGTKGLEYGTVYLVGLSEGSFPSPFAKSDGELEEERRLFFVAITRAKNCLRIFGTKSAPSPFLKLFGNRT